MESAQAIVRWGRQDGGEAWVASTLDQIGGSEELLEDVLANHPALLRLESRRTGIRGPYAVFRQLGFDTPQGRGIRPDIVLFAASGHVIVVEAKLHHNPELRDRRVLAQVIDYAASFSALREKECQALFIRSRKASGPWSEFVQGLFPGEPEGGELANEISSRLRTGELNLVIACDRAPTGLDELIRGVASQSAVGFDLDLVEVIPYVRHGQSGGDVVFVPRTRLATEIVARTAVTVTYRQGEAEPSVDIQTASVEEIEENVRAARGGRTTEGRMWTPEQVHEAFADGEDSVALDLLEFAQSNSAEGRILAPGPKVTPTFGFYVAGVTEDQGERCVQFFRCSAGYSRMTVYLNMVKTVVPPAIYSEFTAKLRSVLGDEIDMAMREPSVPLSTVGEKLDDFKSLALWVRDVVRSSAARTAG